MNKILNKIREWNSFFEGYSVNHARFNIFFTGFLIGMVSFTIFLTNDIGTLPIDFVFIFFILIAILTTRSYCKDISELKKEGDKE